MNTNLITTADIIAAVNTKLKTDFPNHKPKSTDFRKNVVPGSFYVELPEPIIDRTADLIHESGTIRICYFPTDENNCREEIVDMQGKLGMSFFSILRVTDEFVIPINDLSFDISDNVLIASFDYDIWQYAEEADGEMMEHLDVEVE